jgi:hypothetical protein
MDLRAWLALTLLSCAPRRPEVDVVWHAGCAELAAHGACALLKPRALRVWLPDGWAVDGASIDGAPRPLTPLEEAGLFEVEVPTGPADLALDLTGPDGAARWTLPLQPLSRAPAHQRAVEQSDAGDAAGARATVEAALEATPADAAPLRSALARMLRGTGDDERVAALLREAIPEHLAHHRPRAAARDATMLAFYRARHADDEATLRWLVDALPADTRDMSLTSQRATLALRLAERTGHIADGEHHAAEAITWARRAGGGLAEREPTTILARLLLADARYDAAIDTLTEAAERGAPCERAPDRLTLAWAHVYRGRADAARWQPGVARAHLDRLEQERAGCPSRERDAASRAAAAAWTAWLDGAPDQARAALSEASADHGDLELQVLTLDLAARLTPDGPEAVAAWSRVVELGRALAFQDLQAHALRERARVQPAPVDALADLHAAATISGAMSPHVGWRQRDRFLSEREPAAELQARLLAEADRPADAIDALRAARSSYLRSLLRTGDAGGAEVVRAAQAELGRLHEQLRAAPASELPALEARRSLILAELEQHLDRAAPPPALPPLPRDALVIGLVEGPPALRYLAGSVAPHLAPLTGAALGDLPPLPPGGVVLQVSGALLGRDLHGEAEDGTPLIAEAPVRWSLDLPPPPPRAATRRALLLIDPTGDLPAARQEGELITQQLQEQGYEVRALRGAEATVDALRAALAEGLDLLHVAGHAQWDAADADGALLLGGGQELSVAEILLMPAPRVVMLAACETASTRATRVSGLGLGQAFVLAGAEVVVAAARPVADDSALAFVRGWYAAAAPPAAAFRAATLTLYAQNLPDAYAFRLLTP